MPALSKRQRILAYRREEAWILAKKTKRPAYVAQHKEKAFSTVLQTEGDAVPDQAEWIVREVITPSEARRQLAPPSLRHLYDEREGLRGACTRIDEEGERYRNCFKQLTDVIGDEEPTPQPHPTEDPERQEEPFEEDGPLEGHQSLPTDDPNWPGKEELDYLANSPGLDGPPSPIGVEDNPHVIDPPEETNPAYDWPETGKLSDEQANTLRRYREKIVRENLPYTAGFTPREMNAYTSVIRALARRGLLLTGDVDKDIMDRRYSPARTKDMERLAAEKASIEG